MWVLGPVKPITAKKIYMAVNEYVQGRDGDTYFLNQQNIKTAYIFMSSPI